jgi:hypothetical protein
VDAVALSLACLLGDRGREPGCVLQAREVVAARFVGDALDLERLFVVPADDQSDVRVAAKVRHLPGRADRVEDDLQVVAHGKAHDGRLRGSRGGGGCLVGQKADGDSSWTVSFTMPEAETLATLPEPTDARVTLREVPPVRVGVVKFSGRWTNESFASHAELLRSWLSVRGLRPSGEVEVNRYDPPWTPWFMRRNEVWLTLDAEQATLTAASL